MKLAPLTLTAFVASCASLQSQPPRTPPPPTVWPAACFQTAIREPRPEPSPEPTAAAPKPNASELEKLLFEVEWLRWALANVRAAEAAARKGEADAIAKHESCRRAAPQGGS